MLKPLLSKVKFEGWGFKFSLEDLNIETIIGLIILVGAIVFIIKG